MSYKLDETTVAAAPGYWSLVAVDGEVVQREPVIAWRIPSTDAIYGMNGKPTDQILAVTPSGDAGFIAPMAIEMPDGQVWALPDNYYDSVDDWLLDRLCESGPASEAA